MRPAQAIVTGFSRSFDFSGRASRAEYWWFLPVGLGLPAALLGGLWLFAPGLSIPERLALSGLALWPLAAVTMRRLIDTGTPAEDMHPPTGALVVFLTGLLAFEHFLYWGDAAIEAAGSANGFILGLMLVPFFLGLLACLGIVLIFGAFSGASLFGHMFLPSHPLPIRSGPNRSR